MTAWSGCACAGVACLRGARKWTSIGGWKSRWSRVKLVTIAAAKWVASALCSSSACDVTSFAHASSHALELHRADAIHFAAAIFTNLTQDHLDFHETMEDYFSAKQRLFEAEPGVPVINVDDPYGARLVASVEDPVTFALQRDATYRAT